MISLKIQQDVDDIGDLGNMPDTYYDTIDEAYNHKGSLQDLKRQLEQTEKKEDTYAEQIEEMQNKAIQEVDYEKANETGRPTQTSRVPIQTVLTAKGLIHKDQDHRTESMTYLNQRLAYFLGKVKLPHTVIFQSGPQCGNIENWAGSWISTIVSRCERNRLILSLSWAFRDVWESLYQQINLLFIDELDGRRHGHIRR